MPKTKSSDIVVYHRYPLQPQCNQRLPPSSVRGRIPHCIRPLLARTLVVQSAHRLLAACLLSLRMASSGLSAVFRRVDAVARRRPPLPPPLPGLANILLVPVGRFYADAIASLFHFLELSPFPLFNQKERRSTTSTDRWTENVVDGHIHSTCTRTGKEEDVAHVDVHATCNAVS